MENVSKDEKRPFDLVERTAVFGELAIEFAKSLPWSPVTNSLIDQFIRAATGVGANYSEADCAESRRDYEHKVGISKKEARELYLIFSTIVKNSRARRDVSV